MSIADRRTSRTVVLGLGNPLMGDDGFGLAALQRLRDEWTFDPAVELVDGGTWGMNLLPIIEDAARLLLLDAIDVGAPSGTLVILERGSLPMRLSTKLSPHQIDVREVLALAELRGTLPADTVAIGMQPGQVEMSTELSAAVEERMPHVVEAAVDRLQSWGHTARALSAVHA